MSNKMADLQIWWFPILLSILLFTLLMRSSKKVQSKLPPGPRKLPFIGNLHNLATSFSHHFLRDLSQKYGPLMHLQLGELSLVVASSPEMAKAIMKTHDAAFASEPSILTSEVMNYGSKGIILVPYGEYWRKIRKICTMERLSAKRVQSFRHIREDEYFKLARWIASNEGSTINLSQKIFSTSYSTTSRIAFGERSSKHEGFKSVVVEVMKLSSQFDVEDLFPSYKVIHRISGIRPKFEKLCKEADRIIEGIIKDHKIKFDRRSDSNIEEEALDDLVDVLLKYEQSVDEDITLTMENVKAVILDIFSAGSDTSAVAIEWALSEMIKNPKVLKKAQAEVRKVFEGRRTVNEAEFIKLEFLKMVIKETLRLHPPTPLVLRECREKCEINGYEIPSKTMVIINGWAINRDDGCWENADTFDPERFRDSSIDFRGNNFEYIPFGGGRRICPGTNFGLANVELLLAMLLYHFDWALPDGTKNEDLDMVEWFQLTARRKNDLCLIPKVYHEPLFE